MGRERLGAMISEVLVSQGHDLRLLWKQTVLVKGRGRRQ